MKLSGVATGKRPYTLLEDAKQQARKFYGHDRVEIQFGIARAYDPLFDDLDTQNTVYEVDFVATEMA